MSDELYILYVSILDWDYGVSCLLVEVDDLKSLVCLLDECMCEICCSGKIVGVDCIVVMVVLNIVYEFIRVKFELEYYDCVIEKQFVKFNEKIERALASAR